MVSPDGKTWQTRTSLAMADFAVSPSNADVVLATTEQGLVPARTVVDLYSDGSAIVLLISWADDGTW